MLKKILFFTLCIFFVEQTHTKNTTKVLFFDLNDVLVGVYYPYATAAFGLPTLVKHNFLLGMSAIKSKIVGSKKPVFNVEERFYKALRIIMPDKQETYKAYTAAGEYQPQLLQDFDKGIYTSQQAQDLVTKGLEQLDKRNFFQNSSEKSIIKTCCDIAFNPETRTSYTYPLPGVIDLVQKAQEAGYKLYILSNIAEEIFDALYDEFRLEELFSYFPRENCIIAGATKTKSFKPDPAIFDYVLEKYHLKKENCILIDSVPKNIEAARRYGMRAFLLKHKEEDKNIEALEDWLSLQ